MILPEGTPVRIGSQHAVENAYDSIVGQMATIKGHYHTRHGKLVYKVNVFNQSAPFTRWNVQAVDCIPFTKDNEGYAHLLRREGL